MSGIRTPEVVALEMATFSFAPDEPHAGEEGVVMAYVVRHATGTLLFDTGFGFGSQYVDDRYHPVAQGLPDALDRAGVGLTEITDVVNCHLHIDHAGQNSALRGVPIHVQPAEWQAALAGNHTILEWVDVAGGDYRLRAGDYDVYPGIRVLATPGHTAGHQSLVVETAGGLSILAGQACYSRGEWAGEADAREGLSRAPYRTDYVRSLDRLRSLRPDRVYFAHDRELWTLEKPR